MGELLAMQQKTTALSNIKNSKSKTMVPSELETRRNDTGIPNGLRTQFETLSGFSFDDVRIHYHSDKPARFGALAYTQGNQVYVGAGQERHLPHELGHIVQQKRGGVRANFNIGGQPVNNDAALERQADTYARQARSLPSENVASYPPARHEKESGVVQRIIPQFDGQRCKAEIERWNALIANKNALHARYTLGNNAAIDALIRNLEEGTLADILYSDRGSLEQNYPQLALDEHSDSVFYYNAQVQIWSEAFGQVKGQIIQGLTAKKIDRTTVNNFAWDDIIPFFNDTLAPASHGFLDIRTARDVPLSGGHGRGDTWEVRNSGAGGEALYFGSVPNNAHGRNDRALNGTRGALRTVIDYFNEKIDECVTNVLQM